MRHYTPDERTRIVSDWRSSGMTRKAFAKQHGVSPTTLSMWYKRIDASASPVAEMVVGALTVRIYAGIADSTLSALLNTLRREVAC